MNVPSIGKSAVCYYGRSRKAYVIRVCGSGSLRAQQPSSNLPTVFRVGLTQFRPTKELKLVPRRDVGAEA